MSTDHHNRCPGLLLVDMPFAPAWQPNLGLSLLRQIALAGGWRCRILYASLRFAAQIGAGRYRDIASRLPADLLYGDLVFAGALREGDYREALTRLGLADPARHTHLPAWAVDALPDLRAQAREFVDELASEIAAGDENLVGFNLMFQSAPSLALADRIKRLAPGKRIVLGGASCEGEMGLALHEAYPSIDFVCRGEGERLLGRLLAAIGAGGGWENIPGLVWRGPAGESLRHGQRAEPVECLDTLPDPAYEDFFEQAKAILPEQAASRTTLPLETSRGCWWGEKQHCVFCGLNGESLASRAKSPARALAEIEGLRAYPTRRVLAADLIFPHGYYQSVLPQLAEQDDRFEIFYEIKANVTRRQLELLRAAGVRSLQPGIESLSSQVLRVMRKGVSAYQNVRLLKWSAELGLKLYWNLLYGFPGEEADEYAKMAEMVPSLAHLQPPLDRCFRVRMDRFSPLFFDREAFGLARIRPAPAYSLVHCTAPESLGRLAYHFEYDLPERHPPLDYVAPLMRAVDEWHRAASQAAFTMTDDGNVIELADARAGSPSRTTLSGLERKAFLACDEGHTLASVASRAGSEEKSVAGVLEEFVARRWVLLLDDRYVSLAVANDAAGSANRRPASLRTAEAPAR